MKVTGGDCQETLKLLPLGVNLADPGMVTGGVACYKANRNSQGRGTVQKTLRKVFPQSWLLFTKMGPQK